MACFIGAWRNTCHIESITSSFWWLGVCDRFAVQISRHCWCCWWWYCWCCCAYTMLLYSHTCARKAQRHRPKFNFIFYWISKQLTNKSVDFAKVYFSSCLFKKSQNSIMDVNEYVYSISWRWYVKYLLYVCACDAVVVLANKYKLCHGTSTFALPSGLLLL